MDKLEPIRAVFRQAGLYNHAADDLLCERLAVAALDAARGDVRQRVEDTLTDYLDHYPHPEFLDAVMAHFAPPAASDALAELDHARSRIDELTAQLDHARRRIGELTIQLGESMKPAALALPAPLPPTPDTMNLTDAQREVEDAFRLGWNSCRADVMQAQQPAAAVPEGYALVPMEPTQAMRDVFRAELGSATYFTHTTLQCADFDSRYRAMLAAARKGEP